MSEETNVTPEDAVEAPQAEEVVEAPAEAPVEEAPVVEEAPAEEAEEVEVPAKFKTLVETVEGLSVLELHELVKLLEKKFGVSAAAVAVAAPGADAGGAAEQEDFEIILKDSGASKIGVIKAVKVILGLGLKEAKELVDGVPSSIKTGVPTAEAEEIKGKLEEAGATVELK
jgi:large subunit ribosomal protein L7/L12